MHPSATVTFLFSDIEGSTRLWEYHPQTMTTAIAWHDAEWQKVVELHNGRIVKTTGDGLLAVFDTAADAVRAVVSGQLAMIAQHWPDIGPLRVRTALHSGDAETRDGDFYGSTVNRAARLMSIASGDQILLSAAAAELVRDRLPPGVNLADLGEHRLRGLERPEHVFQLLHSDLPVDFPPLKSSSTIPNNLPLQLTSFIGREREIEQIRRLLAPESLEEGWGSIGTQTRLLTLTGPGGTGKTRLSLQVAGSMLEKYPEGVWFVELASLTDPQLIVQYIAASLGLREQPGRTLKAVLTDFLHPRHLLLILDNCEHLIDECARLAAVLLRSCQELRILATSREALGIAGEQIFQVGSLPLPDGADTPDLDELADYEAIQLFVDRAAAVKPEFVLTDEEAPSIIHICQRLDGIPLAIELAAARMRVLSPEQIADRLDDRFRLLAGGNRIALPRQRTLQALIDWSYDLLSEPERILLRRLSVFSGGWTLEAAEAVTGNRPIEVYEVLNLTEDLVNKSLVVAETHIAGMRYSLLETIRQYAQEKLEESGEAAEIKDRHLYYFVNQSQKGIQALGSLKGTGWLLKLAADSDNLRTAREWALKYDLLAALKLLAGLTTRWSRIVPAAEVLRYLEIVLEKAEFNPDITGPKALPENRRILGAALAMGGGPSFSLGLNQQALDYALRSADIAREVGDLETLVFAGGIAAAASASLGDQESAQRWAEESQSLAHQIENRWIAAMSLVSWGSDISVRTTRDSRAAWARWEEGMAIFRQGDELWGLAMGYQVAATTLLFDGKIEEAQTYAERSFSLYTEAGDAHFANIPRSILAELARKRGDLDRSTSMYREIMQAWYDQGNYGAIARCMECLAFIAHARAERASEDERIDNLETASGLLGAADAMRQAYNSPMTADELPEYESEFAAVRRLAGESTFQKAWGKGHDMNMDQAISFALGERADHGMHRNKS